MDQVDEQIHEMFEELVAQGLWRRGPALPGESQPRYEPTEQGLEMEEMDDRATHLLRRRSRN